MFLSNEQNLDLLKAILRFFIENKQDRTATSFLEELEENEVDVNAITEDIDDQEGLLERKWQSVIRLNDKVEDLESRNAQLQTKVDELEVLEKEMSGSENQFIIQTLGARELHGHRSNVTAIKLHPTLNLMFTGCVDGTIRQWDVDHSYACEHVLKGHTSNIISLELDPKNKRLFSGSADTLIKIWDLTNQNCTNTLMVHDHMVSSLVQTNIHLSDYLISSSRDGTIRRHETEKWKNKIIVFNEGEWIKQVRVYLNYLIQITDQPRIVFYDMDKEEDKIVVSDHTNIIESFDICGSSHVSAVTSSDWQKDMYPDESDKIDIDKFINGDTDQNVGKSTKEEFVIFQATCSRDMLTKLQKNNICLLDIKVHDNWVRTVKFIPNSRYLITSGDDKKIIKQDLATGEVSQELKDAHEEFVTITDIQKDGRYIVSAGVGTLIKIWKLK